MANTSFDNLSYETTSTSSEKNVVCSGKLRMVARSAYKPKDNPFKPRGEDAHFILPQLQTFGVADGVGGCAGHGIDVGEYSRQLMKNTVLSIREQEGPIDPRKALNDAVLVTETEGASTACILSLHDDCLNVVNVGDSGFVHIRDGKIIYKTKFQQHNFNVPYQLSYRRNEDMDSAEEIKRVVVAGDVIVAGTDGLFDNVHDEELETLVANGRRESDMPKFLSRKIARFALRRAGDDDAITPFAIECRKLGFNEMTGGKYDDITVVVAFVLASN